MITRDTLGPPGRLPSSWAALRGHSEPMPHRKPESENLEIFSKIHDSKLLWVMLSLFWFPQELVPAVELSEVVLPHRGGPRRAAQELG